LLIKNVQILSAGTYTFPASSLSADQTLICAPGTVFEGASLNANGATIVGAIFSGTATHNTVNGIYKDCTFTGSNGLRYGYVGETAVFENCVFSGNTYGIHFDGGANEVIFKNCTFSGFNATAAAVTKVTFDGCTFNGNSKTILAHGGASTVININNCKFAATEKGYTGAGDNTAVVEMDPIGSNTYTINFTGENTITDSYAGWTRVKDGSTGHTITGLN
jgi:uncharacterized protein YjbI with pentapeptide repeats